MTDLPERGAETYLGDGLYVSFDGWGIRLRTPRESGDHWVGIDPEVYCALVRWIEDHPHLKQHMARQ